MKHARNCAKYAKTSILNSQYKTGFSCPAADDVMGAQPQWQRTTTTKTAGTEQ